MRVLVPYVYSVSNRLLCGTQTGFHHYRARIAYGLILITLVLFSTSCFNYGVSESPHVLSGDPAVDKEMEPVPSDDISPSPADVSMSPPKQLEDKNVAQSNPDLNPRDATIAIKDESVPPDLQVRVIEAIAQDLGQPATTLTVESITAQTWPDGCLGLADVDEFCTMALVDGWQITLNVGNISYSYRSNKNGTIVRQAN